MGSRVLIVDTDDSFVESLKYTMEQDEYRIDICRTGKEAIEKIEKNSYELVLMELGMPDMDGLTICRHIRKLSLVPIIFISEEDEEIKKILALEYGADDYMVKPFNILELKARIKAIFRRINEQNNEDIIETKDFVINTIGRKVVLEEKNINLTGKEFDLLYVLASNPGKIFTRQELLERVWGYAYYGDLRTVDVHIRRIREKIEKNTKDSQYIMTKWGVGYYFNGGK